MDAERPTGSGAGAVCEACGRGPARAITARRQVGLVLLRRAYEAHVVACRDCGRGLVERYTARTLWQGWWGVISFFANWYALVANARAWLRLGRLSSPSLSGELPAGTPGSFPSLGDDRAARPGGHPRAQILLAGGGAVAAVAAAVALWDDSWLHEHDQEHGRPATVGELEALMSDGRPFVDEQGNETVVTSASCTGEGEASDAGYVHFDCHLVYADGAEEDVVVHLLVDDEIFFTSYR